MQIGDASRASGVSARSLRFYEDEGLIVPGRCTNGYRDYCRSTIERVRVIRSLLEAGLPVRLIRIALGELATDAEAADPQATEALIGEVRRYRERLSARIAALEAQRQGLDGFLAEFG